MKNLKLIGALLILSLMFGAQLQAQETNPEGNTKFYLKPYAGFIGIQDMTINYIENDISSPMKIKAGFGFTTGISFGYNFNKNFSTEIGWEYKKNLIDATLNDLTFDGDYASNFVYLNAMYRFTTNSRFSPYLGIGGSYIEEVDMDFGTSDNNFSFQENGQIGFQFLTGLDYSISNRWSLNWELRNNRFSNFDLTSENSSMVSNLKYNPFVINIGVRLKF